MADRLRRFETGGRSARRTPRSLPPQRNRRIAEPDLGIDRGLALAAPGAPVAATASHHHRRDLHHAVSLLREQGGGSRESGVEDELLLPTPYSLLPTPYSLLPTP